MQHDLVVFVAKGEWGAQRVRDALQAMRKSPLLGVNQAVLTQKDSTGLVNVLQRRSISSGFDGEILLIIDRLVELIFGNPSPATLDELRVVGLDIDFIALVAKKLQANSSALVFLLDRDGLEDSDELLEALSLFKGKIYKTTLSEVTITTILETNIHYSST